LFCDDDLMKLHCSIRGVRWWHGLRADPIHECFDVLKGMNNGYLPSGRIP
jgi:predicted signal transduction protein with EAL and GGDEF domain